MLLYVILTYVILCNGITFNNIASSSTGINFARVPSVEYAIAQSINAMSPVSSGELLLTYPQATAGFPGVALIDFNNDDCIDIIVPNGPGAAHSLYENNCDGTYTDIAASAGIEDIDIDGSGACFGDLNNDGYDDIVILGRASFNNIFMNNGDNTFTKSTAINVPGQDLAWGCTCSLGDINNDGYLDIFVGNGVRTLSNVWAFGENVQEGGTFEFNFHNELFLNNQDGTYTDITNTSGIKDTVVYPIPFSGNPTITWANALVDINEDGNLDIILADDQAAATQAAFFGIDRGYVHIFLGDGNGFFTAYPQKESGLYDASAWMGLAFGDLNCDNKMDIFISNFGDYGVGNTFDPRFDVYAAGIVPFGGQYSREMYGQNSIIGNFYDPIFEYLIEEIPTVFGWGCAIIDIENDGDLDIIYYGGNDDGHFGYLLDNPGIILLNNGCDNLNQRNRVKWTRDFNAIPFDPDCNIHLQGNNVPQTCTQHSLRSTHGLAIGDMNNDGFSDIISVSDWTIKGTNNQLSPSVVIYGDTLDDTAFVVQTWNASSNASNPNQEPGTGVRHRVSEDFNPGYLSIEINSGNNNNWIQILLIGGMGILDNNIYNPLSNRNGIGALVHFYPIKKIRSSLYHCNKLSDIENQYGYQQYIPINAGESHLAQHALRKTFGLANYKRAAIDITWPSGNKNVLFYLIKNTYYKIYEIPLSYDDCSLTISQIRDTINAVGDEYGLTSNEKKQYRVSFRLKWRQECSNSANAKASTSLNNTAGGNFIYLYIIGGLALILIIVGIVVFIVRRKLKNKYNNQNSNLQNEMVEREIKKVSSHSVDVL